MQDKEKQEISVLGRLICIETLLLLMGIASLVSGMITGQAIQLFWGGLIVLGSIVLHFVRKKDWKKHWEEQEAYRQLYEKKAREEKEKNGKEKS